MPGLLHRLGNERKKESAPKIKKRRKKKENGNDFKIELTVEESSASALKESSC